MKVGDWWIEVAVDYIYFIAIILFIVINTIIIFQTIILICKELKDLVIDRLRLAQYIFIIICFANWNFYNISQFWFESTDVFYFKEISVILWSSMFMYYTINLLSWYLLIIHVRYLQLLREGEKYQICKNQIHRIEMRVFYLWIFFEAGYLIINLALFILTKFSKFIDRNIIDIITYEFILFFVLLSIFQVRLYKSLSVVLQKNFNFYFKITWKKLSFVMIINICFFISEIALNIFFTILQISHNEFIEFDRSDYSGIEKIWVLLVFMIMNLALYLYAFLNFRGINFKYWMLDLYTGYKILNFYSNASIFIAFGNTSDENSSQIGLSSTDENNESTEEFINDRGVDYDDSDIFMRNYKKMGRIETSG